MATIHVNGYFGEAKGKSLEGQVSLTYTARGTGSLSVEFPGKYRVDLPYHPIELLKRETRAAVSESEAHETVERTLEADGFFTVGKIRLRPGKIALWLRSRRGFEVLTLEYGGQGQISVPFSSVETLVLAERRNLY